MVLCRKCAHTTRLAMLTCPRCGFALPYWRSRHWRIDFDPAGATAGKDCPRCGQLTTRRRSPLWVRPIRFVSRHRCSYRTCDGCGWHGIAFHRRSRDTAERRQTA
jgi:hypothetical protein